MKQPGIRSRILLAALAPAVLVALLISGALGYAQIRQSHIDQHRRLNSLARHLAASAEYAIFTGDEERLRTMLDATLAEPDVLAAVIHDARGRVLASTIPDPPEMPATVTSFGLEQLRLDEPTEHWHGTEIYTSLQVEKDLFSRELGANRPQRMGHLMLLISNRWLEQEIWRYVRTTFVATAFILFFGMLLAWRLSRDLIHALAGINRVVTGIRQGRTDVRISPSGDDELARLARGIDEMAVAIGQAQEDLERKIARATRTLRQERDAAEQATQARSRFFAAASHDLRQPLQALGLFLARLESDVAGSAIQPRVAKIAQTVSGLRHLLDSLLDYSRLDGQVYRVEPRPVDVAHLIGTVMDDFAETARAKGLALRTHVNDCHVQTDPVQFQRILLNLVSNAVRYTERGGVLVSCRKGATHARIEVWDTGPGIAPEMQEKVFEELFQIGNKERDASKGIGLGLAIVRRTADLLGHPLTLSSQVGRGSRFSLDIPLASVTVEEHVHIDADLHADEPRLLLICQQAEHRDEIDAQLSGWGHEVVDVPDADGAATWMRSNGCPAGILWDISSEAGHIESALAMLDWMVTVTGHPVPAILIAPGPLPTLGGSNAGPHRLLLVRPYRPARLRALLTRMLEPQEETEE